MPHETKLLSADQYLLTTLMVKLAVVAILATMLVRFPWFRRILLTEKRDWPERLIFAASLGFPLTAGVVARLLLDYKATDLTLAGSFLAGLLAGPYAGAIVGVMVGIPATVAGEWIAFPFAIGCGFAGGGLREICPKEAIWHFSPLFFTDLHRKVWRLVSRFQIEWVVILLAAPIALEILRQFLGIAVQPSRSHAHLLSRAAEAVALRPGHPHDGAVRRDSDQDLEQRADRAPAAGAGEAADGGARRGARQPDQPALPLQHADLDLVADPLAAGNGADADRQAVRAAAPPAAQPGALRDAARRSSRRSTSTSTSRRCASARSCGSRRRSTPARLDIVDPQHAAAAARRELDQARPVAQGRRGRITIRSVLQNGHTIIDVIDDGVGVNPRERRPRQDRRRHRPAERQRAAEGDLRRELPAAARQRARRRARAPGS